MKKYIFLALVLLALGFTAGAQQLARRSQFIFNTYMMNPAVAGTTPYSPITASFRNQWAGFDGAPKTYMVSGHTRLPNINLGLGAIAFHDNTGGAIARTGAELTGAYSIDLNNRDAVSFGLSAVMSQFRFDASDLVVRDVDDQVLLQNLETTFNFDATFGMMVYGDNYFFGFSIPQLIQTRLNIEGVTEDLNQNVRHYNFMGSYFYYLNDEFAIQPSALVRFTERTPVQFDVLMKGIYMDMFWVGLGYRHLDALALSVGFEYESYAIGYSYDITTSNAAQLSPHTHEVTLSYRIARAGAGFKQGSLAGKRIIANKRKVR
jgi:type IX secretion system PorP/SprF family membrane protein